VNVTRPPDVIVYSTCPSSVGNDRHRYLPRVRDVARWSEAAGCQGILVYSDNAKVDPWLLSQLVIESTERLSPLVAVQPIYLHPYAAAKMIASTAFLHGRKLHLNMLAGGFRNDLVALGDATPHDERYERTVEYTRIIQGLVADDGPVTLDGRYYHVEGLRLAPPIEADLRPDVLISGSSPAGLAAARALGVTAIKYPRPPGEEEQQPDDGIGYGVRVGIVAREDPADAWRVAEERFPEDRKGQITHRLAMKVSDSHWHRQLADAAVSSGASGPAETRDPYWLRPFENYKTFCPYLVGSYGTVAAELRSYMDLGFSRFVLDVPASEEELEHIGVVFRTARGVTAA
jgi:alkanesulfonate monooxygenase